MGKALKQHALTTFFGLVMAMVCLAAVTLAQVPEDEIQAAIEAGNTKTAIELLQSAISADPGYYLNYYLLGHVYYDLGQFARAEQQFEAALDKKSKHYESLYYLGRCQIELGTLDEAEKTMSQGLKKAKEFKAWFENGSGLVALARGNYEDADRAFRRALAASEELEAKMLKDIEGGPYSEEDRRRVTDSVKAAYAAENAEYHINLGDANFFQGVPALAILEYEKALETDTAGLEVYFHWAEACLELKDYNCAIEKLRVVLSKDSTHASAWNRAGSIYFKAGLSSRTREDRNARFRDAIGSYKKYLDLTSAEPDSSNVRGFFELAMSYASIYGFEDAVTYFEKVLAIPYEPKDIYFYYGKSLWGIREYEKAAEMLLKHIDWVAEQDKETYRTTVQDYEVYQLLGDCYFYRKPKDFNSAVKYYKMSLEDRPEQKRVLQNVAIAYHSLKSYAQAIEYYDKRIALGIDSSSVNIYKNAGLCALNLAGAEADVDDEEFEEFEGEEVVPGGSSGLDPNVDYNKVAIDYMNNYLESVPNDTTVILRVANTYLYQLADCANGVSYFERLLSLSPDNCLAKRSLGYAYFGGVCTKNYTKALDYLLDAYHCTTNGDGGPCSDVALVKYIAQCYHLRAAQSKQGEAQSRDFKSAFDWYGKVLQCDPNDQEVIKAQNDIRYEF